MTCCYIKAAAQEAGLKTWCLPSQWYLGDTERKHSRKTESADCQRISPICRRKTRRICSTMSAVWSQNLARWRGHTSLEWLAGGKVSQQYIFLRAVKPVLSYRRKDCTLCINVPVIYWPPSSPCKFLVFTVYKVKLLRKQPGSIVVWDRWPSYPVWSLIAAPYWTSMENKSIRQTERWMDGWMDWG